MLAAVGFHFIGLQQGWLGLTGKLLFGVLFILAFLWTFFVGHAPFIFLGIIVYIQDALKAIVNRKSGD